MIRTITDYYSHEFNEESGITVAYFITKTETRYRVYFYPAKDYFESKVSEDSILYKKGYFFGFTKLEPNEEKIEPIDFKVMNTIVNVVNEFYEIMDMQSILIFHCSDDGRKGAKNKRAKRFNDCFVNCNSEKKYKKYDEEIIINEEKEGLPDSVDKEYLSLIIRSDNPNTESSLEEFEQLKDQIIAGK